jgi:hypothetical protein
MTRVAYRGPETGHRDHAKYVLKSGQAHFVLTGEARPGTPAGEHVKNQRFYFDPEWNPGRQVLVHEQPDSVWRIDWQVPADFDLTAERASGALDARIRRIAGQRPYEIVWLSVYRFHERVAEQFRIGRVFLAGDATHLFAPFGARGLNSGVQDAENVAWKLAAVHHGWVTGHDAERLLDSYSQEQRPAALEKPAGDQCHHAVPGAPRQSGPNSPPRGVGASGARRRCSTADRLGKARRALLVPVLTTHHPTPVNGTPPDRTRSATSPGARRAVPGRALPGARATRLRQLFGAGFVALTARQPLSLPSTGVPVTSYTLPAIDSTGACDERCEPPQTACTWSARTATSPPSCLASTPRP